MWYLTLLFLSCFLAATVVPFSSEIIFSSAVLLAKINPWILVLVAGTGNTLGGLTGYWLGHFAKWEWLEKYFRLPYSKVIYYKNLSLKYGYWLALLCWLPIVGDLLCVVLGFFRSKLLPVAVLMFLGKTIRYALLAWVLIRINR